MWTLNWIGFLAIVSQVVASANTVHDNVVKALIVLNEEMSKLNREMDSDNPAKVECIAVAQPQPSPPAKVEYIAVAQPPPPTSDKVEFIAVAQPPTSDKVEFIAVAQPPPPTSDKVEFVAVAQPPQSPPDKVDFIAVAQPPPSPPANCAVDVRLPNLPLGKADADVAVFPPPTYPPAAKAESITVAQVTPKPKNLFGAEDMFLHILHAMPEDTAVNVHVYVDEDDAAAAAVVKNPIIGCCGEVLSNAIAQKREATTTTTTPTTPRPLQVIGTSEDHSKHDQHYDNTKKAKRQIGPGIDPYAWNPLLRWSRFHLPLRPPPPMGRQQQPSGPPPQESMKRVIFVRCPYYPCPRGFVCDAHTNSCRPLFSPDYDF